MTKVQQLDNHCDGQPPTFNGIVDHNPVYVTAPPVLKQRDVDSDGVSSSTASLIDLTKNAERSEQVSDRDTDTAAVNGETHIVDNSMMNGYVDHSAIRANRENGPVNLGGDPHYYSGSNGSLNGSTGSLSKIPHQMNPGDYIISDPASRMPLYDDMENNVDDPDFIIEAGHREMAVDCPASFVGTKKEPPRYPPPNPSHSLPRSTPPTSPSKKYSTTERTNTDNSGESGSYKAPPRMTREEELQHMERIKQYQEDLRKQREEENRFLQEQEFLRTSLRGSKKLQSLEEQQQEAKLASGIINPNFVVEEEGSETGGSRQSTLPIRSRDQVDMPIKTEPLVVEDLFSSLHHIQSKLKSPEDHKDLAFLNQLFHNTQFQQALGIHNKVLDVSLHCPPVVPVGANGQELTQGVLGSLVAGMGVKAGELHDILEKPEFQALMLAHDRIAQKKLEPQDVPATGTSSDEEAEFLYQRASEYGEESIKIVRLQKTADPLGATVKNEGESVVVGRIVKGGAAEKSGLLHEGDLILEINGMDIRGKSINEVCDLMANMTGTLTFIIVPNLELQEKTAREDVTIDAQDSTASAEAVIHLKAHFNYDPEDDYYIPCRELGISFTKGDILHVINQEDPNWWQAYREGDEDQALAGLIPSRTFQEQREAMKQTVAGDGKDPGKKKNKLCARRHPRKKKKKLYNAGSEDLDAEEILTYEEVLQYYPQPNRKRPIVLIGPPNVGRRELRQRLMESDLDRFSAAIPHTSRPRKDDEVDGKDYHFVPRHVFEQDIIANKFVEHGEYEKNLYGTTLEAIRQVVNSGKICVLNLHPQSLRILKASDLKPCVVFIAPPNLEKLKQIRQKQGHKVTDEELKDTIQKSREIEENYGHYFDHVIVNFDMDRAYGELLTEINRLEVEPQWVPSHWVT